MPSESVFGKNLEAFINSREDLTQETVAQAIGATLTSVNGWINRGIQPRRSNIDRLISAYGLSEDDLMSADKGFSARRRAAIGSLSSQPPQALQLSLSELNDAGKAKVEAYAADLAGNPAYRV